MEEMFEKMYMDKWFPHVNLGNIRPRDFYTRCDCHPDIAKEIVLDYMINDEEGTKVITLCGDTDEPNKPCIDTDDILPEGCDRIMWMVRLLQDVYECAVCSYPCFEDVKKVHEIFWSSEFNDYERENVRVFCRTEPTIVTQLEEREHTYNWIGGWNAFSFAMCALFQLSFETNYQVYLPSPRNPDNDVAFFLLKQLSNPKKRYYEDVEHEE
jgi:hypothetical protein